MKKLYHRFRAWFSPEPMRPLFESKVFNNSQHLAALRFYGFDPNKISSDITNHNI